MADQRYKSLYSGGKSKTLGSKVKNPELGRQIPDYFKPEYEKNRTTKPIL